MFARLLGGWCFPAFLISALLLLGVALLGLLAVPASAGELGAFAREFRVWCLGLDPRTGRVEIGYLVAMLGNPLLLSVIVLAVWWGPLRDVARRRPVALLAPCGAAALLVAGAVAGLLLLFPARATAQQPEFPARELRTAIPAPDVRLTDHQRRPFALSGLQGRVVLVTAVYSTCGLTCPSIMAQAGRVVAALDDAQRRELSVVGVTLDPRRDTPEVLAALARFRGFEAPLYRFLSGEPEQVERALDRLGFERRRDPRTGLIDHANLFLLIDRRGRVAYRFTLGELQERWLGEALRLLLAERG